MNELKIKDLSIIFYMICINSVSHDNFKIAIFSQAQLEVAREKLRVLLRECTFPLLHARVVTCLQDCGDAPKQTCSISHSQIIVILTHRADVWGDLDVEELLGVGERAKAPRVLMAKAKNWTRSRANNSNFAWLCCSYWSNSCRDGSIM